MKLYITLNYKGSVLFLKKHREKTGGYDGFFELNAFTYDINNAWRSFNTDTTDQIFMHTYYNLSPNLIEQGNNLQIQTGETLKIKDDYIKVFNESNREYLLYEIQPEVKHGFKSFGVHLWPNEWVNSYNRYTYEINRTRLQSTRDYLLDNRHKFFMWADNESIVNS